MRPLTASYQLREEAIALRLAGKSVREIRDTLGPVGKRTLSAALKGTPPAEWTHRPNAKDDLRDRPASCAPRACPTTRSSPSWASSKSSVSLWVRDIPCPERFAYVHNERRLEGLRKYNEARTARQAAETEAAAAEIGELTDREILIAGAIAYWCEGTKNKPYRQANRVVFMNSDPGLIRFFLRFLEAAGVNRDDLILRVYIHENADAEAAQRFWVEVTGGSRASSETDAEAPQPKDCTDERRRGLPRLPQDRCPPERRTLQEDRRLGIRRHGRRD